ncbi:hypothetical protein M405DRAFT_822484 [Rhizopogon salebrosus TDB-379]|nr:hypothetical protein M405DRAFT_822484 [Rhizopogon salebrosus TDB-379]
MTECSGGDRDHQVDFDIGLRDERKRCCRQAKESVSMRRERRTAIRNIGQITLSEYRLSV